MKKKQWLFTTFLTNSYQESFYRIVKKLTVNEVPNAIGKAKWDDSRVISILTNEKYTGNTIIQKNYVVDLFSKRITKNNDQISKFYVEISHTAIIS